MRDKARESLRAAEVFFDADCVDPAASRLYYAVFQAAVDWLTRMGRRPEELSLGADRWRHETIVGNASLFRRRLGDVRLLRALHSLRVQADYQPASVPLEQISALRPSAARFIEEVSS
jgi:uncharacterized protein (UPF0332 family)